MIDRKIAPPVQDAVDFDFHLPACHHLELDNGIPVYWLSAGTQDVVQVNWVFKAGLWEENHTGIAHATAGLLKNGTAQKSSQEINEALEFYGASLKSSADNDYSGLTLHCLTKHLAKVLPVVQEIIFEASFPEKELEIYRKNALQHLAVNLEKVDFVANRESEAQVFGYEHPYGKFTTKQALEQLNTAELKAFHQRYYVVSNCTIFMAGNIAEKEVKEVASYFGSNHWEKQQDKLTFKTHPIIPGKKRKLVFPMEQENVQGAVRILRHFPTIHHPDFAPMIILNTLLGGYFGSRLMTNIREDKGFTYGIFSTIYAYKNKSCMIIATEAGKEVCDKVINETWYEMNRLCQEPVSPEELSLVKSYLFGGLLGALDGPFNLIHRWKSLLLNGFDENHFYENLAIYKKISPRQLQDLAQKYFQQEDFYEVLVK